MSEDREKRREKKKVRLTCKQWAEEIDVPQQTLSRRIAQCDLPHGPGVKYTGAQILRAWAGDEKFQKARESRARADKIERENLEAMGKLYDGDRVHKLIEGALLSVANRHNALPGEMAARCNPSDPVLAREALSVWVESSKRLIRAGFDQTVEELRKNTKQVKEDEMTTD